MNETPQDRRKVLLPFQEGRCDWCREPAVVVVNQPYPWGTFRAMACSAHLWLTTPPVYLTGEAAILTP